MPSLKVCVCVCVLCTCVFKAFLNPGVVWNSRCLLIRFPFLLGPDFKTLVTPLVKHVRLHLIDAQDMMQVWYNSACLLELSLRASPLLK